MKAEKNPADSAFQLHPTWHSFLSSSPTRRRVLEKVTACSTDISAFGVPPDQPVYMTGSHRGVLQAAGNRATVDQRREVRTKVDANVLPPPRHQPGSVATFCSGIQPGQLRLSSGTTAGHAALVDNDVAEEPEPAQDCASRPIRNVPTDGDRNST